MLLSGAHDATRIAAEKGIDLKDISLDDARKIMSEEHKALGYRPPHGSLASAAQAAASKHPSSASGHHIDEDVLRRAALDDAARIAAQRAHSEAEGSSGGPAGSGINMDAIGLDEARKLMSAEHKALGYRPPPGSLAADAQAAASKHPKGVEGVPKPPKEVLTQEALKDAARIASQRKSSSSSNRGSPQGSPRQVEGTQLPHDESEDKRDSEPMTQEVAPTILSEEHKDLGSHPPSGNIASTAESLADKTKDDGGDALPPATISEDKEAGPPLASAMEKLILKDDQDHSTKEVDTEALSATPPQADTATSTARSERD